MSCSFLLFLLETCCTRTVFQNAFHLWVQTIYFSFWVPAPSLRHHMWHHRIHIRYILKMQRNKKCVKRRDLRPMKKLWEVSEALRPTKSWSVNTLQRARMLVSILTNINLCKVIEGCWSQRVGETLLPKDSGQIQLKLCPDLVCTCTHASLKFSSRKISSRCTTNNSGLCKRVLLVCGWVSLTWNLSGDVKCRLEWIPNSKPRRAQRRSGRSPPWFAWTCSQETQQIVFVYIFITLSLEMHKFRWLSTDKEVRAVFPSLTVFKKGAAR